MLTPAHRTYTSLINEVGQRLRIIDEILAGGRYSPPLVREFCYLQLRLAAEALALACLAAHSGLPATQSKNMQSRWEADYIIKRLGELDPDFFPRPVVPQKLGPGRWHMASFEGDYLKQTDLVRLVREAGEHLHRGSMTAIIGGRISPKARFQPFLRGGPPSIIC